MEKYYIEYFIPVQFICLQNIISFSVKNKNIRIVELRQIEDSRLSLNFYFYNSIDFYKAKNQCDNELKNILNKIAFEYELASVGEAYYSGNSNLDKYTSFCEINVSTILAKPEDENKLKECLKDKVEYSSRYYDMFRLAMQSTDVVNRYMFLYLILLDMRGPYQNKVDEYIIKCSEELGIDPQNKVWQLKRKDKSGNNIKETIFTYLRNQVGHTIKGHTPDTTTRDMQIYIKDLIKIVKYSMQNSENRILFNAKN